MTIKTFKKAVTTLAIVFSIFSFSLINFKPVQTEAVVFDGNINIKVDRWVETTSGIQKVQDLPFESYNCFTGPDVFRGVDMTKIKQGCQSIRSAGISVSFAYIGYFDAMFRRNQIFYGFYDSTTSKYRMSNGQESVWLPFENNFNAVFVATGRLACDANDCSIFQPDPGFNQWTRVECNTPTISSFTPEETSAICNRSINNDQHFAYKVTTLNRVPNETTFVGTFDPNTNSWVNPITGAPAEFR